VPAFQGFAVLRVKAVLPTPLYKIAVAALATLRLGALAGALASISLAASACGGGGSPSSVAHLGRPARSSTTAPAEGSGGSKSIQQGYQAALAYARCMRTHGFPAFTDPVILNSHSIELGKGGDPSSPQYKSANSACEHLLPNGGSGPTPSQLQQALADDINFAKCMRSHGLPNFPDPQETSGGITFGNGSGPQPGVQKGSPQFRAAQTACRALLPGG
jgi:hypothetical protein